MVGLVVVTFPAVGVGDWGWSYVRRWYVKRQWEQERTREKAKL